MNYYDILGINMYATPEEIRQAYRERIKILHPDKHVDPVKKKAFQEQCKLVNEAYNELKDSAKRTLYNERLMNPSFSVSDTVFTHSTGNTSGRINYLAFKYCIKIFFVVLVSLFITGSVRHIITKDNTIFVMVFFTVFFGGCILVKHIKVTNNGGTR